MNGPTRLREAGSEAPARLRELLQTAQPTRKMTDAEKARSAARIARLASIRTPASRSPFISPTQSLRCAAFGVATVLLGATVILAFDRNYATRYDAVPEQAANSAEPRELHIGGAVPGTPWDSSEPSTSTSAEGLTPTPSSQVLGHTERPDAPTKDVASQVSASPPSGEVSPNAEDASAGKSSAQSPEIVLLEQARRRLEEKNPSAALAEINALVRRFPASPMATDREIIAMDALVALDRKDEAHTRGQALMKRVRGTVDESRVQRKLREIDRRLAQPNNRQMRRDDVYDVFISPQDAVTSLHPRDRSALVWFQGVGDWRFEVNIPMPTGVGKTYSAVVLCDFDGDGYPDLATFSAEGQAAWRGLESGGFGAPIVVGSDLRVEIDDDIAEDDGRADERVSIDVASESDNATRADLVLEAANDVFRSWIHQWDERGVESMLGNLRIARIEHVRGFLNH